MESSDWNIQAAGLIVKRWHDENWRRLCVHPASRVRHLAESAVLTGVLEADDPRYSASHQAMKDVFQLAKVIQAFGEELASPELRGTTIRCFADRVDQGERDDHTPGRDAQFELVAGAYFKSLGFRIERPTDSTHDWDVYSEGDRWECECKRPKRSAKLKGHVLKAKSKQFRRGACGFVAVDLSAFMNPGNRPFPYILTEQEAVDQHVEEVKEAVSLHSLDIEQDVTGSPVAGYLWYSGRCQAEVQVEGGKSRWMLDEKYVIQKRRACPSEQYNLALKLQDLITGRRKPLRDERKAINMVPKGPG